jgi:hypothetical protein
MKAKDKTRKTAAFEIQYMRLTTKCAWTDYKGNNSKRPQNRTHVRKNLKQKNIFSMLTIQGNRFMH